MLRGWLQVQLLCLLGLALLLLQLLQLLKQGLQAQPLTDATAGLT